MTERKILIGTIAIEDYVERSWETILEWIKSKNFPATKLGGRWESYPDDIDRWRHFQIDSNLKTNPS